MEVNHGQLLFFITGSTCSLLFPLLESSSPWAFLPWVPGLPLFLLLFSLPSDGICLLLANISGPGKAVVVLCAVQTRQGGDLSSSSSMSQPSVGMGCGHRWLSPVVPEPTRDNRLRAHPAQRLCLACLHPPRPCLRWACTMQECTLLGREQRQAAGCGWEQHQVGDKARTWAT